MGSFIILVINLTIIKDDDVGNVQKFECLCGYSRHLHTRGNKIQPEIVDFKYHNLSGYIFTTVRSFYISYRFFPGLSRIGGFSLWEICFAERWGINYELPGVFCWLLFFVGFSFLLRFVFTQKYQQCCH